MKCDVPRHQFCVMRRLRTGSSLFESRPARKLMNLTGYKKTEAWSMIARELNLMISCPTCFELLVASRAHGA